MVDRSIRSLQLLETSAASARVLNLRAIGRNKGDDPEYKTRPLFKNPTLNKSIILKHRLRADEIDQFPSARRTATKILIPIEPNDLRLGARYVFIGQRHFERSLDDAFGFDVREDSRDLCILTIMDETPTLDPFLLREQLRRHGIDAALCYFELSQADTGRMFAFAQREIEPLVRMSMRSGQDAGAQVNKLTQKILANSADADLEPLRKTLQLDHHQFQEGVFCWKAFLYYKWRLADLLPRVGPVLKEIQTVQPRGPQTDDTKIYLSGVRETLRKVLLASCRSVKTTIEVYDTAYVSLTQNSDPTAFRSFLLQAPELFDELGERLGGIEHIVSFWRFRFPNDKRSVIGADELTDLFQDFEGSLGFEKVAARGGGQSEAHLTVAI